MNSFSDPNSIAMSLVNQNNFYKLAKLLQVRPKVNIEMMDPYGNTPLLAAAMNQFERCVQLLLDAGANFKQINVFGQNALTLATRARNDAIINMLLAKWTYADYTEASLMPPICVAAYFNDLYLVKTFSKMYPSPEHIKTVHGLNAMTLAKVRGNRDIEEFLLSLGADKWEEPGCFGANASKFT